MPIKPRVLRQTRNQIPAGLIRFFETGDQGEKGEETDWAVFTGMFEGVRLLDLWDQVKARVLQEWTRKHPCSRPFMWWVHDAPREPVPGWEGERFECAQRRRIGGIGTPQHEVLNVAPDFEYGLPTSWIDEWEVAYYNGRGRDVNGNPIGTEYDDGHFRGVAIDPQAPPAYESQASFLDRHSLLTPTEKAYLKNDPKLLEPETVGIEQRELEKE